MFSDVPAIHFTLRKILFWISAKHAFFASFELSFIPRVRFYTTTLNIKKIKIRFRCLWQQSFVELFLYFGRNCNILRYSENPALFFLTNRAVSSSIWHQMGLVIHRQLIYLSKNFIISDNNKLVSRFGYQDHV